MTALLESDENNVASMKRRVSGRLLIVEPAILLYAFVGLPMMTVFNQYFLRSVGNQMGINYDHLNGSTNVTCGTSPNNTAFLQREAVQAEAARWHLFLKLAKFIPSVMSMVIFGAISDRMGRRLCFILPPIGSIWSTVLYLCTIHFNLPFQVFFLSAVEDCFGSKPLISIGALAYLADTVDKRWLTVRFTVVEVVYYLSGGLGEVGAGYLVKFAGYFWSLVFVLCGKVATLLYAIFFIPETISKYEQKCMHEQSDLAPIKKAVNCKSLLAGFWLYTIDDRKRRRWKIWFLSGIYFLSDFLVLNGISRLYQQNAPL